MNNVPELFGSLVFNDEAMRERLPKEVYRSLKNTIDSGSELDIDVANAVANAMKDWATEKGATHYTHWFQPMTGITAEKHDSFISPQGGGRVIMEFSGKELIKGEPDASSFPSGGLRATFEARGYTAWDPTSYAFIKDDSLCIPTAFCSYSGEVLDKKTPLLRSMERVGAAASRLLSLLGQPGARVLPTVGPEQEYFLIDRELYKKRPDLVITGRTLIGARPPKGQELDDHYFGAIRPRVMAFMEELNEELWKLGVYAKTEHNEVAPSQHELAPIFTTVNVATDQNQLTMEVMKKVAERHGLACLLHEKPFAGVNGSGKHDNWSLSTDKGENLFEPGASPSENRRFLLFLCAMICAVDKHQDLLRISVATASNDHRLGANEAPPAIVSMFLGEDLTAALEAIADGRHYSPVSAGRMETGVGVLPDFPKDSTDRNRTSPFAFTGNKFEFRMLGSSLSIAGPNIVLNTIMADELELISERLERVSGFDGFDDEVTSIVRDTVRGHGRIVFNGNNYSPEWTREAKRRGLLELRSTADALPLFESDENISLFTRHGIFTEAEIRSRCELLLDGYRKVINIEALTLTDMVNRDILPAVWAYCKELCDGVKAKTDAGIGAPDDPEAALARKLSGLAKSLVEKQGALDGALLGAKDAESTAAAAARYTHDKIFSAMQEVRAVADELETVTSSKYWPYPTYSQLLYSV